MKAPEHWPPPRWWVVRLQLFVERFVPASLAVSATLFAVPLTIIGVIIAQATGFNLFTRGVVFALLWLAIAPWLLTLAYRTVAGFFDENRRRFLTNDQAFRDLQYRMLQNLDSPRYILMSVPLAIICVWVLLSSLYVSSPTMVRIWIAMTFGILLFLAGMGFWGIARFNYIFRQICEQELKFDPYHADGFGGLAFLGQFNIKGPQYFFSGALLFPIVFEVVDNLPDNQLVSLGLWGVVLAFLAFGASSFLIPQVKIKDIIARRKEDCLAESEAILQTLLSDLCLTPCNDKELANVLRFKIDAYYQYFHRRIMAVREWPFDWKVILQILSSLAIPVIVAIVQALLR